ARLGRPVLSAGPVSRGCERAVLRRTGLLPAGVVPAGTAILPQRQHPCRGQFQRGSGLVRGPVPGTGGGESGGGPGLHAHRTLRRLLCGTGQGEGQMIPDHRSILPQVSSAPTSAGAFRRRPGGHPMKKGRPGAGRPFQGGVGCAYLPPSSSSCQALSSSHLPAAASSACLGQVAGSWAANCGPASSRMFFSFSTGVAASSAKLLMPAWLKASAIFGPMPSTLPRSSAALGAGAALAAFTTAFPPPLRSTPLGITLT